MLLNFFKKSITAILWLLLEYTAHIFGALAVIFFFVQHWLLMTLCLALALFFIIFQERIEKKMFSKDKKK